MELGVAFTRGGHPSRRKGGPSWSISYTASGGATRVDGSRQSCPKERPRREKGPGRVGNRNQWGTQPVARRANAKPVCVRLRGEQGVRAEVQADLWRTGPTQNPCASGCGREELILGQRFVCPSSKFCHG